MKAKVYTIEAIKNPGSITLPGLNLIVKSLRGQ